MFEKEIKAAEKSLEKKLEGLHRALESAQRETRTYGEGHSWGWDNMRGIEIQITHAEQEVSNLKDLKNYLNECNIPQNNPHHIGDLKEHTDKVISFLNYGLDNIPGAGVAYLNNFSGAHNILNNYSATILAAKFHDLGKKDVVSINPKTGYDQFLNHAAKSAELFEKCRPIIDKNISDEDFEYAKELIKLHDTKYSKEGKIKTMLDEHPKGFAKDLLVLQYADVMGQSEFNRAQKLQEILDYARMIERVDSVNKLDKVGLFPSFRDVEVMIDRDIREVKDKEQLPNTKEWLARTASGQDIYIDSQTLEHMKAHPDVNMAHVVEAIGKIDDYNGQFRMGSIDLGREVGKDNCVLREGQEVMELYRKRREGTTPVILDGESKPTSLVTTGICKDDDEKHTMFTAFYGQLAPKEPWDKSIKTDEQKWESMDFWDFHALAVPKDAIDWERSAPLVEAADKARVNKVIDSVAKERGISREQVLEAITGKRYTEKIEEPRLSSRLDSSSIRNDDDAR